MIETKEKYINECKYTCTQFPARRALKLKTKLIKLIAPSIFTGIGAAQGPNILDVSLDSPLLGKAVEMLVSRLDEDDMVRLILEMLSSTRRDGKELTEGHFDMVYAGNFAELFKALFFVLEVNFGSFFQEMGIGSLGQFPAQEARSNLTGL
jgi:hypothetical protein